MKVLIITNAFPSSAEETRGIFTYQIANALKSKCDIEVIAPLPWIPPFLKNAAVSKYPYANVPEKETVGDIKVHHPRYLVIPKILGFMHAVFMFFPLLRLVEKLSRSDKIDLIYARWIFPDGAAATWVGEKLHIPVIVTAMGCDINLFSTMRFRRFQICRALKRVSFITAVSNNLKEKILSLNVPIQKVKVIPNGVDLDLFHIMPKKQIRKKLGIPEIKSIILTVGTQDEVKGTKYLIEAFAKMKKKTELPTFLICIGEGPLRNQLILAAQKLGVDKDVLFAGRKDHREIPLWMNAADVFCLPSIREGHPNVVIEALACGIPVVASAVGAIPEIIGEKNGRICEAGDTEALRNKLLECLEISWDRKSIRKTVGKTDWNTCATEYFRLYKKVVEKYKHNRFLI